MPKSRRFVFLMIAGFALTGAVAVAQSGYYSARIIGAPGRLAPLGGNWMQPPIYNEPMYQAPAQQQVLPQTSASIEAEVEKDGKVRIKWVGEAAAVEQIVFTLLDPEKKVIIEQKVDRLPAEARFPLTNKSAYYRVTITYLNGTKTTVTSLL